MPAVPLTIRRRADSDVDVLVDEMRRVYERDTYPVVWPRAPRRFLAPGDELGAWVAVDGENLVGHIALHDAATDELLGGPASALTGRAAHELAVVARLFVTTAARGLGAGRALLSTATEAAHGAGRQPVLDVGQRLHGAIALYEASGWTRAAGLPLVLDEGTFDLWVYVGPEPLC